MTCSVYSELKGDDYFPLARNKYKQHPASIEKAEKLSRRHKSLNDTLKQDFSKALWKALDVIKLY